MNKCILIDPILLDEIRQYLVAASDGSMSRNNSENLASELLELVEQLQSNNK